MTKSLCVRAVGIAGLWVASALAVNVAAAGQPAATAQAVSLNAAPGETHGESFAVHAQFTYVEQDTSGFRAPYRGLNSLSPRRGAETTDLTVYLGSALWPGAELWINPELDQGFGLDNTLGTAGFPSGEAYKVGKNQPYLRLPRLFVRATVNLGGEREAVEAGANQLGGERNTNRWVFSVGKFGVGDIFDINQYAHDPRADFLNWAAVDAGTFDYAADAWGYTVGAVAERYQGGWTVRGGVFDLSTVPNSAHLDPGLHEFQLIFETERRHRWGNNPGKIMFTVFDSRGRMGLLDEATRHGAATGAPADVSTIRRYRSRLGADVNLEQQLAADLGFFVRIGKAAGNVESYEFTDIDRSIEAGLSLQGTSWNRIHDTAGLAGMVNGISAARQRYLNAGGLGILVGDGRLPHPGMEQIIETYYAAELIPHTELTLDYQWINHPAYNLDRGPVSVFALRFHAQF